MAKKYEVKVYDANGDYLTNWNSHLVSNIKFSNEINTAGGQLSLTLARNAGDYGEGTDVDFNHKVKVYVLDKEQPYGALLFQGYISAYTPIYKDNNVEITVLSFGAELNDYIIEAGETADLNQASYNGYNTFGNFVTASETNQVAQTVTAVGTGSWSKVIFALANTNYANNQRVQAVIYQASAPTNSYTALGTSQVVTVTGSGYSFRNYSFTFTPTVDFTNGTVYVIQLEPIDIVSGSGIYNLAILNNSSGGYAGGAYYYSYN